MRTGAALGAGLAVAVLLAGAGAVGGYAAGHLLRAEPVAIARAAPVPASSPSIPVDPERPFTDPIDYPPLEASLTYRKHTLGSAPYEWTYRAPQDWVANVEGLEEVRWRPADEPLVGGFSMRVKLVNEHKTKAAMVAQKLAAVQGGYEDVEVLGKTQDLLSFSYRDPGNGWQRFNTFQWFSVPGADEARFEMSVVGRAPDRIGLEDLQEQVARSISKVQ